MVVLDTCAVIEICKINTELRPKTLKLIEAGSYILSVSFAEIACKQKLNKLIMNISAEELYHHYLKLQPTIEIINIGVREWLDSIALGWNENRDPADRLITAFAKKNKFQL